MKLLKQLTELFKDNKNGEESGVKGLFNKKFPIVFLLLFLGVIFLLFPSGNSGKSQKNENMNYELDIISYREKEEKRLSAAFSDIAGVEEAKVFITYSDNGYIEVLNDEKTVMKKNTNSVSEMQTEKNPVYNNDKNTVVKKRHAPTISGVCIFYKGDDNTKTRDRLFRAAKGALGTESHKIEIVLTK